MNSYAIFHSMDGSEPVGALRYDGSTVMIVGDDNLIADWFDYFSDPDDLWNEHRFSDDPFGMVFGDGRSNVTTFAPGEGDDEFTKALMDLNGKKIRVVDHEAQNNGK